MTQARYLLQTKKTLKQVQRVISTSQSIFSSGVLTQGFGLAHPTVGCEFRFLFLYTNTFFLTVFWSFSTLKEV
jgi:hypothetical protein